jgi:hypothetical protein
MPACAVTISFHMFQLSKFLQAFRHCAHAVLFIDQEIEGAGLVEYPVSSAETFNGKGRITRG